MSVVTSGWLRLSAFASCAASLATASVAFAAPVATGDIRDIRGPILIPPWWRWPLAIGIAVLCVTAISLAIRWWRSRRPELSPIERARQALARAEAEAKAGRSHEWAEIVAETLRMALATRVGVTVLPQTTSELSEAPWTKPPLSTELDAPHVLELLGTCDIARFARASFDPKALVESTAVAREVTERLFAPPRRGPSKEPSAIAPTVTP